MTEKIRIEVFASEQDASMHAAKMKSPQKGYSSSVERAGSILWDASWVTNGSREEPSDFDNEMWLVISRR